MSFVLFVLLFLSLPSLPWILRAEHIRLYHLWRRVGDMVTFPQLFSVLLVLQKSFCSGMLHSQMGWRGRGSALLQKKKVYT